MKTQLVMILWAETFCEQKAFLALNDICLIWFLFNIWVIFITVNQSALATLSDFRDLWIEMEYVHHSMIM